MARLKLCCAPGCEEVAPEGLPRCAEHEAAALARLVASRAKAKRGTEAQAGSKLYADRRWRAASKAWLDQHPLCVDCASVGLHVGATDVDHITPHRGDRAIFWDRTNWQSLCHPCHSRKTARERFARPRSAARTA